MSTRKLATRIVFTLVLIGACRPSRAERVYRLVDYPALQNGHTLSGSITTTDNAPTDGILHANEILGWEWNIGGQKSLNGSSMPTFPYQPVTTVQEIVISDLVIEMPRVEDALLLLSERWESGRGPFVHTLAWFTRFDAVSGLNSLRSAAGNSEGDVIDQYWLSDDLAPGNNKLIVATVIPEPVTINFIPWILVFASGYRWCVGRS